MAVSKTPEEARRRIEEEKVKRTGNLDLSGLGLEEIPPELTELPWLLMLDCSFNKLSQIDGLETLTALETLLLTNNQLQKIEGLETLNALETLRLTNNQLQKIEGLETLTALETLELDDNQLQKIEGLETLTALERLSLNDNQLQKIEGLETLTALKTLELDDNQLQKIEGLETLTALETLLLGYNQLQELKPIIPFIEANDSVELYLQGNAFRDITPEIAGAGNQAILHYFKQLGNDGVPRDQVKIIFLGNSSSGKTSLSRFLSCGDYNKKEITTHGILQTPWNIPTSKAYPTTIQANIWDFGGQQYYHATHRLFLSHGAVYVVACAGRLEVNGRLLTTIHNQDGDAVVTEEKEQTHHTYPYWLETISWYAGTPKYAAGKGPEAAQPRVQVFLVETKGASRPENLKDLRLNTEPEQQYAASFELHGFDKLDVEEARNYALSRESGIPDEDMPELVQDYGIAFTKWKRQLISVIRGELKDKIIPKYYPILRDWLAFRAKWGEDTKIPDDLRERMLSAGITPPESYPFILPWLSRKGYENVIREVLPPEEYAEDGLDAYLLPLNPYLEYSCGQIIYLPELTLDGELSTEDTGEGQGFVCIDPQWLHDRIYDVLDNDALKASGRFTLQHVDDVVEGPENIAKQMVGVMKKFRLIFEVAKGEYIAPQYLPEDCPEGKKTLLDWSLENEAFALCLSLVFPDYLPPSIITEYIAQKGSQALKQIYWSQGLMYRHEVADRTVHAYIVCQPGKYALELWLPAETKEHEKNAAIRDFVRTVVVDIAQHTRIQLVKPGYEGAPYDLLCDAKRGCVESVQQQSGLVKSAVYFPYLPDYGNRAVNIFISYSHEQMKAMKAFSALLKDQVARTGIAIKVETDIMIPTGEYWDQYLQGKVDNCDILICLVSHSFLNSRYIGEKEFGRAKQRLKNGEPIEIFPIYFDRFNAKADENIRVFQLYRPDGERYRQKSKGLKFSFCDIVGKSPGAFQKQQKHYVADMIEDKLNDMIDRVIRAKGLNNG